ncbi:MAG: ABC transporter ATP-binding protein, partial [Pseudomonadota bacterium]
QFELVKIQESLGVTFIVVTHDQEEAMTLATRIGVMDAGRIVQIGEPHDVYETPRNRFVADFIGSVNLIEGVVVETAAGRTVIRTDDAGIVQSEMSGAAADGQRVWYAVRPEKLTLSRAQPDHTWNAVEGIVDDVAYLGGQSIYRIRLGNGRMLRAALTNRSRTEQDLSWDDPVHVTWERGAGMVLTE